MDAIALRRTKDMALVGLPPKTTEICYVELSLEERQLYDQVKEQTKTLLSSFHHEDSLVPHYSAVLSRILRLRQICTDLKLCKDQSLLLTNIEGIILSFSITIYVNIYLIVSSTWSNYASQAFFFSTIIAPG